MERKLIMFIKDFEAEVEMLLGDITKSINPPNAIP
jgi:hypothetical protein